MILSRPCSLCKTKNIDVYSANTTQPKSTPESLGKIMTFAHALPFSISGCVLQYVAASKHHILYVTYSYLAVSTETLDCESIKQSQMKLEKKLARNEAINPSILHYRSYSVLEGVGQYKPTLRFWSLP